MYCIFKLITGEEIISELSEDNLTLIRPHIIVQIFVDNATYIEFGKYSQFADNIEIFNPYHVISSFEAPDDLIIMFIDHLSSIKQAEHCDVETDNLTTNIPEDRILH